MRLQFSNERSIKEIRDDFKRCFPYLKPEFFKTALLPGQATPWDEKISGTTLVGKVRSLAEPVIIEFPASGSVASLEQQVRGENGFDYENLPEDQS